ncbi:SDR family oxidoreductase [Streptomyces sp. M19]
MTVRRADFADPASLSAAFAGADKLLLVSTTDVGERVANHRRAIEAAREAGVSLLAYTSMTRADAASTILGVSHRETEELLRAGGVPYVLLRNSWYLENYTAQFPVYLQHGIIPGSAGKGLVSAATRADYAEAAATVLTTEGHAGAVYELGGDHAFSLADLATALSAATGRAITYTDLPEADHVRLLTEAGLPAELAEVLADADRGLAAGELFTDTGDLSRLLGRPTTTLTEATNAATANATATANAATANATANANAATANATANAAATVAAPR